MTDLCRAVGEETSDAFPPEEEPEYFGADYWSEDLALGVADDA